ncbi:MAG: ABC transporter permease [Lachnospiraceae bacterium]|nr:ABC transporter permease [Lachnospiraceae bacterium]
MSIVLAILGAVGQGMLWGVMALGVYITFRILNFADMTCDGSFALGGCVSVILIATFHMNPFLSLIFAVGAGMLAGLITGLLHTRLKIPAILSGILTMIGLYSINIRILGKKSNVSLLKSNTLVTLIKDNMPGFITDSMKDSTLSSTVVLGFGLLVVILLIVVLYWFFGTEAGSALRATGNNEDMIRALGQNTDRMKILGLVIGNGLVALSGAFVAQSQGYADVDMGQGTIVIGLASIVIGEAVLFGKRKSFYKKLAAIIVGSLIYRIVIAIVLQLGLETNDLKLLTALIVATALAIPGIKKQGRRAR